MTTDGPATGRAAPAVVRSSARICGFRTTQGTRLGMSSTSAASRTKPRLSLAEHIQSADVGTTAQPAHFHTGVTEALYRFATRRPTVAAVPGPLNGAVLRAGPQCCSGQPSGTGDLRGSAARPGAASTWGAIHATAGAQREVLWWRMCDVSDQVRPNVPFISGWLAVSAFVIWAAPMRVGVRSSLGGISG